MFHRTYRYLLAALLVAIGTTELARAAILPRDCNYGITAPDYDATYRSRISQDPLEEAGGFNMSAFCNGDPVNNVDPLGLDAFIVIHGISGDHAPWDVISASPPKVLFADQRAGLLREIEIALAEMPDDLMPAQAAEPEDRNRSGSETNAPLLIAEAPAVSNSAVAANVSTPVPVSVITEQEGRPECVRSRIGIGCLTVGVAALFAIGCVWFIVQRVRGNRS